MQRDYYIHHVHCELWYVAEVRMYCILYTGCVLTIVMVDVGKALFFHQRQQYSVSGSKQ
jgi:hypothetical protein